MRYCIFTAVLSAAFCSSCCVADTARNQSVTSEYESAPNTHRQLYRQELPAVKEKFPITMQPDQTVSLFLPIEERHIPMSRVIRVQGLVSGCGGGERAFRDRICQIEDSLEQGEQENASYYLSFIGQGETFERIAYLRLPGDQFRPSSSAVLNISAMSEGLTVSDGGSIGVKLEIYQKKDGRHDLDIFDTPDDVITMDFDTGVYGWKEYRIPIPIPDDLACILLSVGGKCFSGKLNVECPTIIQERQNIHVPPLESKSNRWLGKNLSKKEWPVFEFSLDGEIFVSEPIFQRAATGDSDFEIELPKLKPGEHTLKIRLASDWPNALGFVLRTVDLLEYSARDFEIISWPEFIHENGTIGVLLESNKDMLEITCSATEGTVPMKKKLTLSGTGLHVIQFRSGNAGSQPLLTITDGNRSEDFYVTLVTSGKDDGISVGCSDWIYINLEQFDRYLEWYCSSGIGDAMTIRPSYQWNGTRDRGEWIWEKATRIFKEMDMPYSLMVEGRTLPGAGINPKDEWLNSPLYLGRQAHEDDGSFHYWGQGSPFSSPFLADLFARSIDVGGIFPKSPPVRDAKGTHSYISPFAIKDMPEGTDWFVNNLRKAKGTSTRHSGPSWLFRYFYMAGYDWLSAEQFYGPEEIVMSALRGASRAYGKRSYGTHHATQWGQHPYDSPSHAMRQFMSHAVAYMHGADYINTEDALWTTERCHHRFSEASLQHIKAQRDFYHYVQTHRRRGKMVTPLAVLYGRNDSMHNFSSVAWSQSGSRWRPGEAEASYDLLKIFYPRNSLSGFSVGGTPYGPIDILPVEAGSGALSNYNALMFLGWNSYDQQDFERMLNYVNGGGTLLMTRAHCNTNSNHNEPASFPDSKIVQTLLGDAVNATEPVHRNVGKGNVIYFPANQYPANNNIRKAYETEIKSLGSLVLESQRKRGWVRGNQIVGTAVWDWDDQMHRTIYLLNTDWQSDDPTADATLMLDQTEIPLKVRKGIIETVTICNGVAVTPSDHLTDVLSIKKNGQAFSIRVQTVREDELTVYISGTQKPVIISVPSKGVYTVTGVQNDIKIPKEDS